MAILVHCCILGLGAAFLIAACLHWNSFDQIQGGFQVYLRIDYKLAILPLNGGGTSRV
jgi:hypothetical protein